MKKIILIVVLLIIILGAGITEHICINKTFEEFNERLDAIDAFIDGENAAAALEKTVELQKWWDKKRQYIESVSYTPDIRSVNVIIGEIEGSLATDDLKNAESKSGLPL